VYALPDTGIDEASSPYEKAENRHVTPASANETMIDGPASPIASPMMTKIPVPMTAPIPRAVRSRTPTARLSPCSGSASVSRMRTSVGLRAITPARVAVAMEVACPHGGDGKQRVGGRSLSALAGDF
jgi:hypothetical protein